MTIQQTLNDSVAQVQTDASLLHTVVHGDDQTTVTTNSGTVKSVAKVITEMENTLSGSVIQAQAAQSASESAQTAAEEAQSAAESASADAAATVSSLNAGLVAHTTTSLTIGTGLQDLVVAPGLAFRTGHRLSVISAVDVSNRLQGIVTAYDSETGALAVDISDTAGSGTYDDWSVLLDSLPGPEGPAGPQGERGPAGPIDFAQMDTLSTVEGSDLLPVRDASTGTDATISVANLLSNVASSTDLSKQMAIMYLTMLLLTDEDRQVFLDSWYDVFTSLNGIDTAASSGYSHDIITGTIEPLPAATGVNHTISFDNDATYIHEDVKQSAVTFSVDTANSSGHFVDAGSQAVTLGSGGSAPAIRVGCHFKLIGDSTTFIIDEISGDGSSSDAVSFIGIVPTGSYDVEWVHGSQVETGSLQLTSTGDAPSITTEEPPAKQSDGNLGTWTYLHRSTPIPPSATVTRIVIDSNVAQTITLKIAQQTGNGQYTILYSEDVTHGGGGVQSFTLSTPYTVSSSGTFLIGAYGAWGSVGPRTVTIERAFFGGNASGSDISFTEDSGGFVPMGFTYHSSSMVLDAHDPLNADTSVALGNSNYRWHGQSFQSGAGGDLERVTFHLKRQDGSTDGPIVAQIYAHTGSYGTTSGLPTGSPLATSDAVNADSISTTAFETIAFTFSSDRPTLVANTNYVAVLYYANGSSSKYLYISLDQTGNHAGVHCRSNNGTIWSILNAGFDCVFSIECVTNSSRVPIDSYYTTTTNTAHLISDNWSQINSSSISETLNDMGAFYTLSFDGRASFWIWEGSAWRCVAYEDAGTWKHSDNGITGAQIFSATTSNNANAALSAAMDHANNRMTGSQMSAISTAEWNASNGFNPNQTTLDMGISLQSTNVSETPMVDEISINHDTATADLNLIFQPLEGSSEPISAKTTVIVEPIDSLSINSDLTAYSSLDDGSTWDAITLVDNGLYGTHSIYSGTTPFSTTDDQTCRLKLASNNAKRFMIHGASYSLLAN
ncbi:MAG: collagen-like protein [Magnetococcales bacterium]|nr:collagen-like protein [Magnetococcales bacterium]